MKKQTKIERYLDIAQIALIYILSWTWGIIQQIAALCLRLYLKITKKTNGTGDYDGFIVHYCHLKRGSVSLGNHVFLCPSHWEDETVLAHELGHCRQSLILGPLYMFVIGIPSVLWCNVFWPRKMKKWKETKVFSESINENLKLKLNVPPKPSYYDFYTEKWANKLMGLELK